MNPIQKKSVEYAKSIGFLAHKMDTGLEAGWPDYLFVGYNTVTLFVEFKRPGEPLRPAQSRMITKMAKRGFGVSVIDNVEEFKTMINLAKLGIT